MTLKEALVELRELRWELQLKGLEGAGWGDNIKLTKSWAEGARLEEALQLVEQLGAKLVRGPRLDATDEGEAGPREWCTWFEAGERGGYFSCCEGSADARHRMLICDRCKWRLK